MDVAIDVKSEFDNESDKADKGEGHCAKLDFGSNLRRVMKN